MKKSFKKSIAVLLAVLMVVCAFPLTAFAAEKPNVNLQFGVLSVSKTDKRTYSTNRTASNNALTISGLKSAKLDYNKSAGTITDTADSYTYAVGDYFTATVLLENVSQLAATQVAINYSSNIVPAGICNKDTTLYGAGDEVGTVSDKIKAGEPIAEQSGNAIYNTTSTVGELSYIDMDTNTIYASFAVQDGSDYVSTASTSIGANTFSNTAVLATFGFKITAEGPISFSLANTTDADEAYYLGTLENGGDVSEYITYAPTENAGSTGLDFMGGNEYVATTKHTIVFKNEDGTVISSTEYDEGAAVTVPDLPATSKDDTNHYTYAWDVEPSLTAIADATYQVVKTGAAHIWGEGVVTKDPTATEDGEKTFTCTFDGCGATKTEAIPATGETHTHTWGEWVYNGDASYTSSSVYKDGTATRTCACGETETKTIEGTGLLRANTATVTLGAAVVLNIGFDVSRASKFDSTYIEFEFGGSSYNVSETSTKSTSSRYYYDFDKISPEKFGDEVTVTVYGVTADGIVCRGHSITYSIKKYAYQQLGKAATSASLKTLLVELLYYGAEYQTYRNYNTSAMITADLTEEQKALHTTDVPTYEKLTNVNYQTNPNGTGANEIAYKSATLLLEGKVIPRIKVEFPKTSSINDYTFVWEINGVETAFTYAQHPDWFVAATASSTEKTAYYVDNTILQANQFSIPFYLTVYKGAVAEANQVSNVFRYSVESYATGSTVTNNAPLKALVDQLLRYGRADVVYMGGTAAL